MPDIGIAAPTIRSMDILDQTGHTALGWEEGDDEWVIPLIRLKMQQGFVFWIVRRAREGTGAREVQLRRVEQIGPTRRVIIKDPDARRLFDQGRIGLHVGPGSSPDEYVFERRAVTPEEVARNHTVAQRRMAGG